MELHAFCVDDAALRESDVGSVSLLHAVLHALLYAVEVVFALSDADYALGDAYLHEVIFLRKNLPARQSR